MRTSNFNSFHNTIKKIIPSDRIITDPLRTLAYGSDASFYRLIPKIVIKAETETEIIQLNVAASKYNIPITYRAAGTSLSGQAISDSVLVMIGSAWGAIKINEDISNISLQPGVIGARANLELKMYGKKIGPDPASINSAMIGGIAANNASGMCCGTAQNSYNTLAGMKIVFANGERLDTGDSESIRNFKNNNRLLFDSLVNLSTNLKSNTALSERITAKYKMKNTTGYSLNALVDFTDPIDIIQHLMIGSEGTLGFISEITYKTVHDSSNKASSLMIFNDLSDACSATPILRKCPVDAVEIMDRASLRSVEDKAGMPTYLKSLKDSATALLIETSADSKLDLNKNIEIIKNSLQNYKFLIKPEFTDIRTEYEKLWKIRKGLFPSVGAMRKSGTTVIIEDVCFPIAKLADAAIDLQLLFNKYHYYEAIIFGHSLEGNLHFVFSQDFNSESEVKRYSSFMNEITRLVVDKYDGSLKAEHGTGRNMAPFVEDEWGSEAYKLMKEIKKIFDPQGILNPGVILNEDPTIHLKNLKPLPSANPIIDKCIECGFCEINCPSKDLTLTPRQRIIAWREIQRLKKTGTGINQANKLVDLFNYFGNETCATDGLCSTSCPVNIDTGKLIKELRADKISPTANSIANFIANNMEFITASGRYALNFVSFFHAILGDRILSLISGFLRSASFNLIPRWTKYLPKGASKIKTNIVLNTNKCKVVYFPSCITRTMGPAKDYKSNESVPTVTAKLLEKAGYAVIYPGNINNLCCGMAFNSKGFVKQGKDKADELLNQLIEDSNNGEYPVLFDMGPCLQRMRIYIEENDSLKEKVKIYDQVEFINDFLLDKLTFTKQKEPVSIHITCSGTKLGLDDKFRNIAEACSEKVIFPKDVGCCGFAGDRGFSYPELNASALKNLKNGIPEDCKQGYSNSRTCEIGLSEHSGINYQSIVYLVDKVTSAK
ncbi:MAG: 4Fe-4S ferredoxin [Ignavibacteriae bacterium HGW-Ignavibacteriae-2]|nr:MAG: 4Fe-4S ferredoxin [Ignavibacteriae bacterium HGW-Ignavibacteriae-2]